MSKTRDNTPELDYFELRRRHEEFKRARSAPQPEKNSVEERLERQVAQQKARPEPAVAVEETPVEAAQDTLDVETKAAPMDAFEEAIEENYEAFEDDMDYDEESDEEVVNPNPFDSFIRLFNGMKANRASRRRKDEEFEDLDLEDLTDEELAELEDADLEDLDEDFEDEPVPAKPRFSLRRNARSDVEEEEAEEAFAAEDIEDLDDSPRPVRKAVAAADDEDFDDDDFEGLDDEDFDDEDFDDEDFDDEDEPRKGGFKKFVNLFVTRVDEDEEDEDFDDEDFDDEDLEDVDFDDEDIEEIEEDEEEPVRKGFFSRARKNKARHEEDEEIYDDFASEMQIKAEGGQGKMDEMNKPAFETTAQADVIETSGMSRRERRELAMRLAAEEAARKAEEEARAQAEAAPVEPLFTDLEVKQDAVDMAAFEGAPETDLIVETTAEEVIETVDEPTREFTPVSMRDVQEAAEKALFDVDDEDEDFDDEDDDEEEIIEKKPRRGLFGRKRAKDEDEDDEDDFDDEDDEDEEEDDEDDEDEEEIVEKKPRRGLFGRKRAKDEDEDDEDDFDDEDDEDDDEDDEDLEDDYDDEDEDDEYDEYDDDEEDDYDEDDDDDEYDDDYDDDDDDDEPRRSFGHHLIGVFKIILALILVLLVLVIGLNFHYFVTGENVVLEKTHELLGDSSASDVLCFGYVMRETMPVVEAAPEAAPEVETVVEPTALPQAEIAIPDLNNNGAITETPVVEAAPVIEAAPAVAETPVEAGTIG